MKPYIGIVHHDDGSAYGITFPDAPGCFSAADTLDDLFTNAEESLGLWLDQKRVSHLDIELLRDLSDIKRDPAWIEAFAAAVLVIAVSPPQDMRRAAA